MHRLSSVSIHWLVSSACALSLAGCSDSGTPGPRAEGGASSAGSPSGGASAGLGGGGASAGSAGQAAGGSAGAAAGTSSGGSGGTSAGSGAGGSAGATGKCGGALLCEDFESYTGTPGAPWQVDKNAQGDVVIDGAQHHSGSKAVKFTLSGAAAYQRAFIGVEEPFPIANNAFYGRMMIYITAAPNDGVHWTMIQAEGPVSSPMIERAMVRYGGQHAERLMANYDSAGTNSPKSDCWRHSQTAMPEGKWACMEWYFEGATNTQKLWLDGAAVDDLTVVGMGDGCVSDETGGAWIHPTYQRVYVGWESYQADSPREVWIDDVAVGTTKIGCPQ